VADETNAKKTPITKSDALSMVEDVQRLYVAKGKSFSFIDLAKESPDQPALEKLLLGPTGNLRAPTVRKGKTLIVGFNEDMYRQAGL
jgi:arsenate reductase-like glutaredoxin family protein